MKGAAAFLGGFRLLFNPGIKRFVLVPVAVNLVVFVLLVVALWSALTGWVVAATGILPSWLDWLAFLIQPLAALAALVLFFFGFTVINGFIAAPFYGILAEKVEQLIDPSVSLPDETFTEMTLRTLKREVQKWAWYIPRALLLVVLSLIPVLNLLAPPLWLLFGIWVLVIEYRDYINDNHGRPIAHTRAEANRSFWDSLAFGGLAFLGMSLPLLNLLTPSAAIAGATAWAATENLNAASSPRVEQTR